YFYSTYETEDEAVPLSGPKVIVLGSGPIRIGQGIEFDYSAVHAVEALREAGIKAIVINNNPETVSTDYHLSDRLYFEPLTLEEVLNVVEQEQDGLLGVIAQFGGQTALNLIGPLAAAGVPILGTAPATIALTEDRKQMAAVCAELGIRIPSWSIAHDQEELAAFAPQIGFPVLVRPSYVLGGRGMRIIHNRDDLLGYLEALGPHLRRQPVLVDQYLEDAIEIDVDGIGDGRDVYTVIMEQIEAAGVHSGDSACVYPAQTLATDVLAQVESYTARLVAHLQIRGLINVQYAVKDGEVYLLEVNARASRTVPFASKATGVPLARLATQLILGALLADVDIVAPDPAGPVAVKGVVFPFSKFPALVPRLGPEMQSTGESMGRGLDFATAFARAQQGAGFAPVPLGGAILIAADSLTGPAWNRLVHLLQGSGFTIRTTPCTAERLWVHGIHAAAMGDAAVAFADPPALVAVLSPGDEGPTDSFAATLAQAAIGARLPYVATLRGLAAWLGPRPAGDAAPMPLAQVRRRALALA
ncbi:MAG TPA: ATP-grasp domain-containing protein, partial [Chloroflexia bacterium]|nr:ATP-grasp domain-containing protein [Chloroflexia bacterium]